MVCLSLSRQRSRYRYRHRPSRIPVLEMGRDAQSAHDDRALQAQALPRSDGRIRRSAAAAGTRRMRSMKARWFPRKLRSRLKPSRPEAIGFWSIAGQDTLDQLSHCWHEAVGVEGIVLEAIGVVPGEHQIVFRIV